MKVTFKDKKLKSIYVNSRIVHITDGTAQVTKTEAKMLADYLEDRTADKKEPEQVKSAEDKTAE